MSEPNDLVSAALVGVQGELKAATRVRVFQFQGFGNGDLIWDSSHTYSAKRPLAILTRQRSKPVPPVFPSWPSPAIIRVARSTRA